MLFWFPLMSRTHWLVVDWREKRQILNNLKSLDQRNSHLTIRIFLPFGIDEAIFFLLFCTTLEFEVFCFPDCWKLIWRQMNEKLNCNLLTSLLRNLLHIQVCLLLILCQPFRTSIDPARDKKQIERWREREIHVEKRQKYFSMVF